jgi:hypothetical protein
MIVLVTSCDTYPPVKYMALSSLVKLEQPSRVADSLPSQPPDA